MIRRKIRAFGAPEARYIEVQYTPSILDDAPKKISRPILSVDIKLRFVLDLRHRCSNKFDLVK